MHTHPLCPAGTAWPIIRAAVQSRSQPNKKPGGPYMKMIVDTDTQAENTL